MIGPRRWPRFGASRLTVTGALAYQACDDKVCFNAVTVPLSWTLPLQPMRPASQGRQTRPPEGPSLLSDCQGGS